MHPSKKSVHKEHSTFFGEFLEEASFFGSLCISMLQDLSALETLRFKKRVKTSTTCEEFHTTKLVAHLVPLLPLPLHSGSYGYDPERLILGFFSGYMILDIEHQIA